MTRPVAARSQYRVTILTPAGTPSRKDFFVHAVWYFVESILSTFARKSDWAAALSTGTILVDPASCFSPVYTSFTSPGDKFSAGFAITAPSAKAGGHAPTRAAAARAAAARVVRYRFVMAGSAQNRTASWARHSLLVKLSRSVVRVFWNSTLSATFGLTS